MRRAKILKVVINSALSAGLGALTLFGGVARADSFTQRMQAELNSGKDYSAAATEASRAIEPLYVPVVVAGAKQAQTSLSSGQDYFAAWQGASQHGASFTSEQIAKAEKAGDALNRGKDYAAAVKTTPAIK